MRKGSTRHQEQEEGEEEEEGALGLGGAWVIA